MLYAISKFFPVLMHSNYKVVGEPGRESCWWIQWRERRWVLSRGPA